MPPLSGESPENSHRISERLHTSNKEITLICEALLSDNSEKSWSGPRIMTISTDGSLQGETPSSSSPSTLSSSSSLSSIKVCIEEAAEIFFCAHDRAVINTNIMKDSMVYSQPLCSERVDLDPTEQHLDVSCTRLCSFTSSSHCLSPSSVKHHQNDMTGLRSTDTEDCNRSRRHQRLQDECNRPEVENSTTMRMASGSHWSRLLVLALGLWTVAGSGVHCMPLSEPSEMEQAYRKLQMNTVKYLAQFGYLKGPSRETQNLRSQEDLTRAIKALQKAGNIPQTGVPDRRTEELMTRPRCGNTDDFVPDAAIYRDPYNQGNELRVRKKRYTVATSKWPRTNLTFRFETYTKHLPKEKTRQLISSALNVWSEHTPLSFTEVRHSKPDINIMFASKFHQDGYPFDGPGMVLGHAFFPGRGKGGDTHFDEDEKWADVKGGDKGVDLFMVAAHEFGHSLGLAHSGDPSALMYPWYMGAEGEFKLPDDDYRGITSIYGSGAGGKQVALIPESNDPSKIDPTYDVEPEEPKSRDKNDEPPNRCTTPFDAIAIIRGEMFIFMGKWYLRKKKDGKVEFHKIHQFWIGFPENLDHIDAAVELQDRRILFFSGNRYWLFNGNQIIKPANSDGRPLTDFHIPEDVKKIDAAFVWGYNLRTYLVSGDMYWKMDEGNNIVEYDYPRDMGTWKGVPVPLDAAFQDLNGKTLFFQGNRYWEFYDLRMRVRRGSKLKSRWLKCPEEESEDLKIKDPTYIDNISVGKPRAGDAAERKSGDGKNTKDEAQPLKNISLTLLFVTFLVHFYNFSSK